MTHRVVVLRSAEAGLKELRAYVESRFGREAWRETQDGIRSAVETLRAFPEKGRVPDELEGLGFVQYRQLICGRNRILYEIGGDTVYIHIICDARRDYRSLLLKRMLGM